MKPNEGAVRTARQLRELVAVTSVIFVLGVLLATVVGYDKENPTTLQQAILGLHAFIAVYVLVIAVLRLIRSYKLQSLITESWIGLVGLVVAFACGSYVTQIDNEWAVMGMAVGFLVALLAYGSAYVHIKKRHFIDTL